LFLKVVEFEAEALPPCADDEAEDEALPPVPTPTPMPTPAPLPAPLPFRFPLKNPVLPLPLPEPLNCAWAVSDRPRTAVEMRRMTRERAAPTGRRPVR
jgi:hypothetical protein